MREDVNVGSGYQDIGYYQGYVKRYGYVHVMISYGRSSREQE